MNNINLATRNEYEKAIFGLLAEDQDRIFYRKSLRGIAGSVTATILLSQFIYWFNKLAKEGKDKFYKFRKPCKHKLYKVNDSWTEELGFSGKEFDFALKKIGTKITKGVQKSDVLEKTDPTGIVLYWTDDSRVTWYQLNRELLGNLLLGNYLVIDQKGTTLKLTKGELPLVTETTTETTTETPSADAENGAISKQPDKHNGLSQAGKVDEAIAQFVSVTGFAIPTAKRQLKLWQTGTKEHLAEEQFSGQLPELYKCVWDNIEDRVRAGELTITHPGAFTQYMYGIAQFKNKQNGPMSLDQLVSAGIVEVKTIEDKVGFFWPDGTLVGDITPKLIEKHSYHNSLNSP